MISPLSGPKKGAPPKDPGREQAYEKEGADVAIAEESRPNLAEPPKFAVILVNDDYTTMEFVIEVLQKLFKKTFEEAAQVMLKVHQEGRGVAGVYSFEIAETKVSQVEQLAQSRGFPLKCALEPN